MTAVLTIDEAPEQLRVSRFTISRLIKSGCLKAVRTGWVSRDRAPEGPVDWAQSKLPSIIRLSKGSSRISIAADETAFAASESNSIPATTKKVCATFE